MRLTQMTALSGEKNFYDSVSYLGYESKAWSSDCRACFESNRLCRADVFISENVNLKRVANDVRACVSIYSPEVRWRDHGIPLSMLERSTSSGLNSFHLPAIDDWKKGDMLWELENCIRGQVHQYTLDGPHLIYESTARHRKRYDKIYRRDSHSSNSYRCSCAGCSATFRY